MRFLANMSHEFRTPMSAWCKRSKSCVGQRPERREAGGTGHRLEQRIPRTINSILDYTRWSQDVVPVSISTVGLGGLVRRVVARHSAEISRRGLALHLRLDLTDSEDFVKTDAVMLAEVLGRLLANAVKFTPAGRIDLGVELRRRPEAGPTGVSIEASVVDTGIGIPTRSDHGSGRRSIRSTTPATGRKAEPGWVWRSSRSWCRPRGVVEPFQCRGKRNRNSPDRSC
jgi:signal transduction histidine kinase